MELFNRTSEASATLFTKAYSTSFSIAVRSLAPSIRQGVYNVYGFVRVADEIVDSFDGYPKEEIFNRFEDEFNYSLKARASSNPIINAFQNTVHQYDIDLDLVKAFLKSMRADLKKHNYTSKSEIDEYIYGSADVVGLMCLKIFVQGDQKEYERLKEPAMRLGSAFQKVNFLRDFRHDFESLGRTYFPYLTSTPINEADKNRIVEDIRNDFEMAYEGVKLLPNEARLGVYIAYKYFKRLLNKIDKTPAKVLVKKRVRISNIVKLYVLLRSSIACRLNHI